MNFRRAMAEFMFGLCDGDRGEVVLHDIIECWPHNAWGYIALADAYSHLFRGTSALPLDLQRAEGLLRQGLAALDEDDRDREILNDRLQEIQGREVQPVFPSPA